MAYLYYYLYWHYTLAVKAVVEDVLKLAGGILNFFSVSHLLATIFSPWHRYIEPYKRGFRVSEFVWILSGNAVARVLGAIIRLVTIIAGIAAAFLFLILGFAFLIVWLLLPFAVPALLVTGIVILL